MKRRGIFGVAAGVGMAAVAGPKQQVEMLTPINSPLGGMLNPGATSAPCKFTNGLPELLYDQLCKEYDAEREHLNRRRRMQMSDVPTHYLINKSWSRAFAVHIWMKEEEAHMARLNSIAARIGREVY